MTTREEFITGLRQLTDFLTDNPDVPVPPFDYSMQVSASGYRATEEERIEFVRRAALGMGVQAEWNEDRTHFEASLQFGPIRYFAVASTTAHMADFDEEWRLGREALKAAKAEREANTLDGEVVEYLPAPFVKATPAEVADAFESSEKYAAGLLAQNADDLADDAARTHQMQYTQSGRDSGHAICGSPTGHITLDDNDVTCIACLEQADEQYELARGVVTSR